MRLAKLTAACGGACGAWWIGGSDAASAPGLLPTVYDHEAISSYWIHRPRAAISRFASICGEGVPFVFFSGVEYMIPSMAKEPAIRARELKELLIRLG